MRVLAALLVIIFLTTNSFTASKTNTIGDQCFVDYSFIWTQPINDFMSANMLSVTRYLLIISSMGMDFAMAMMLLLYVKKWETNRIFWDFLIFTNLRNVVQNLFSM